MIRNVIFDWSGTLVDDLPAVLEATNHVLKKAGRPALSRDQFREEFQLPFRGFYERHTPQVSPAQLEEWFHSRFREVQDQVHEIPHAREFLEFCRRRGLETLVLSTMHPDPFSAQARALGFDAYLPRAHLGVRDKRTRIHAILAEQSWRPEETVFIGDMEHDVETAKHGGVRSVAVLTGYNRCAQLRRAAPDLIVEHLGELQRILERSGLQWGVEAGSEADRRPVVTVGAAVFDDHGRVLMVRTQKWSDRWGIPGGKVRYGETSEAALRRELREETGLEVEAIRLVLVQDCVESPEFYRNEHFVLLNYRCRAVGTAVQLNHEAQAFQWLPLADAAGLDLNGPTRVLLDALRREAGRAEHLDATEAAVGELG